MDSFDRKILGVLIDEAGVSYEILGQKVGLSAPAAHARVKKLRENGSIERAMLKINPVAAGKLFLAFVLSISPAGESQRN